jgi:hypothetical protein
MTDPLAERLVLLLRAVASKELEIPARAWDVRLRDLGLESGAFVAFLNAIERDFRVVWDPDAPSSTFDSIRTIADHLHALGISGADR